LSPAEAVELVDKALEKYPGGLVIGIAGPGEPLANPETFYTLERVREKYPDIKLCLCTNGLLLPEYIEKLSSLKINQFSMTINGVSPEIVSKIQPWVRIDGRIFLGKEGAKILIGNQLAGLQKARQKDIFIKVNTVVIPGINAEHVVDTAKTLREYGAGLMNLMPLIPIGEFRSHKPPDQVTMMRLRRECSEYLPQFLLCRQCRADAIGIPGLERKICL